jgi:tRNA threonylcarbamoyl adenosine modification protein YjeE
MSHPALPSERGLPPGGPQPDLPPEFHLNQQPDPPQPDLEIAVPTAAAMQDLGRQLATLLRPGDLVVLNGGLGAGKTTLVRGIGAGLGVRGPVTSPTFVIARIHPSLAGGPSLVHADAYRLGSPAEVDDLDLDADLDTSVTVVEWGGGLVEGLAAAWLDVTITPLPEAPGAAGPGPGAVGPGPGAGGAVGEGVGEGDEPRAVRLTGHGDRWAAAAGSVRLALSGAPDAL